jgi:hypothetical protein
MIKIGHSRRQKRGEHSRVCGKLLALQGKDDYAIFADNAAVELDEERVRFCGSYFRPEAVRACGGGVLCDSCCGGVLFLL